MWITRYIQDVIRTIRAWILATQYLALDSLLSVNNKILVIDEGLTQFFVMYYSIPGLPSIGYLILAFVSITSIFLPILSFFRLHIQVWVYFTWTEFLSVYLYASSGGKQIILDVSLMYLNLNHLKLSSASTSNIIGSP